MRDKFRQFNRFRPVTARGEPESEARRLFGLIVLALLMVAFLSAVAVLSD